MARIPLGSLMRHTMRKPISEGNSRWMLRYVAPGLLLPLVAGSINNRLYLDKLDRRQDAIVREGSEQSGESGAAEVDAGGAESDDAEVSGGGDEWGLDQVMADSRERMIAALLRELSRP